MLKMKAPLVGFILVGCSAASPTSDGRSASAASASATSAARDARIDAATHVPIHGREFPDKVIALTWDDGPDAGTLELAEYLARRRISATFFVVRSWIQGLSDEPGAGRGVYESGYQFVPILGDLVALGHRIGNHTSNHVVLREAAGAALVDRELRENQQNIDPWLTNELRLFRAPGGGWGPFATRIVDDDPYLSQMVGPIAWDVDRKDWEESLRCERSRSECEAAGPNNALRVKASIVAARYLEAIEKVGRGIVLLHDRVGHVGSSYGLDIAQALIPKLEASGYVFAPPVLRFSPLSLRLAARDRDATQERRERFARGSLALGDIDGDGSADACGRDATGVGCALSSQVSMHHTRIPTERLPRTEFRIQESTAPSSDRAARELQLADVTGDGRHDACLVRRDGVACGSSDVLGRIEAFREWSPPSRPRLEAPLLFGDVDGDGRADVCARTAQGVHCARSWGDKFGETRAWLLDAADPHGLLLPKKATALQLADVDGDERADLCARGAFGIACAISTGKAFGRLERWSTASDFVGPGTDVTREAATASDAASSSELRFGDVNGDGRADVCALDPSGIRCALSRGRGFANATVWASADAVNAQGWRNPELALTIQLGDINGDGRADLCGRSEAGVVCGLAP